MLWQLCVHPAFAALLLAGPEGGAPAPASAPATKPAAREALADLRLLERAGKEMPRWLRLSGELRTRFEGFDGAGFKQSSDSYLLTRLRLNLTLTPTNWWKFHLQSQDSRLFWRTQKPYGPPHQDTWDLRLAFTEFGAQESSPVALRLGRQELAFGDERLLGAANWSNSARSFDAARLILRHGRVRLDAFAASVVVLNDGRLGEITPGNNLHGIWARILNPFPHSTLEPFVLWRLARAQKLESGGTGHLDTKTWGFRWTGKLLQHWDYVQESALQRGSIGPESVAAFATHSELSYRHAVRFQPKYTLEYNHASGDASFGDRHRGTFDQLYATAHERYGMTDQIGWKNMQHLRAAAEFTLSRRWQLTVKHGAYWLASARDGLYNTSNAQIAVDRSGASGRWVGQESAAHFTFKLDRYSQIGAGIGHLVPGTFLRRTTAGHHHTSAYSFFLTSF